MTSNSYTSLFLEEVLFGHLWLMSIGGPMEFTSLGLVRTGPRSVCIKNIA